MAVVVRHMGRRHHTAVAAGTGGKAGRIDGGGPIAQRVANSSRKIPVRGTIDLPARTIGAPRALQEVCP